MDNQTTYVDERFISQCGRLIADVLQTTDVLKLSGMLVTIDYQKIVFHLIKQNKDIHGLSFFDHTFLYTAYPDDTTLF